MRVSEEARVAGSRRDAARRGDFDGALRRAEARRTEAGRAEAGRGMQRAGERLAATRGEEARDLGSRSGGPTASLGPGPPGARGGTGAAGAQGADRLAGSGLPSSAAGAGPGQAAGSSGPGAAGPAVETAGPALAQAVRALPPVIERFQASGQAALSLDFGAALGVELRQAPGGVEVRLSASAALQPAARAELAGLCRTLAARGVAVVSAEVRGRPGRGRP